MGDWGRGTLALNGMVCPFWRPPQQLPSKAIPTCDSPSLPITAHHKQSHCLSLQPQHDGHSQACDHDADMQV